MQCIVVLSVVFLAGTGVLADAEIPADWRDIRQGAVIPDEGYCDQPYVVITQDGHWLCTMTTGAGREGQKGQHVVASISADQGRTWTPIIDIEPADGPEASWAMPLVTPSGRVYVFYDYNGERVDTLGERKGIRADVLGWYVYKYSDDHGRTWSNERWRLPVRETEYDRNNDWDGKVQMFWGIGKPIIVGHRVYLGFSKIGKHVVEQSEGWFFRSENLLTEQDPDRHEWVMLPDGDVGLRSPEGPIAEEQNLVALSGGALYTVYRTVAGYICHAYSRDGGRTWTPPAYATYTPDVQAGMPAPQSHTADGHAGMSAPQLGRKIKNPRACARLWQTKNGKYLLWYHNHGGKDFKDRNPAWLAGGVEVDGKMHWSQPEIVLYDPDPAVRMSYPDLIEEDGRTWITETQKSVARVHEIDPELIEGLWSQGKVKTRERDGLVVGLERDLPSLIDAPRLTPLDRNGGFSVEFTLQLESLEAGQAVLDARDSDGRGFVLKTTERGTLTIALNDGEHAASWDTDPGVIVAGKRHHVVVTVDGGPDLITFVVDGELCDGGAHRQYGWGRFPGEMGDVSSGATMRLAVGESACEVSSLHVYDRALRTSEAVGNYLASQQSR